MSNTFDPEEIKRREYLGLICLMVGILTGLCGLTGLLFIVPMGLLSLGLGVSLTAAGLFILNNIPNVLSEELG